MKYVILVAKDHKMQIARAHWFVFSEMETHSEVAARMQHMIGHETGIIPDVHSAGFCSINNDEFDCYVGSESLKISKEDPGYVRSAADDRILNSPNALQGMIEYVA